MPKLRVSDIAKLPDGCYADGAGLYLYVRGNSRSWILRKTVNGKRIKRGLGSALTISLSQARAKTAELNLSAQVPATKTKKFKDFYLEAIEHIAKIKQWKNPKSRSQWTNTITTYVLPIIGNKAVGSITTADIRLIIDPIYENKTETASRLIGRLKAVFDYAQVCKLHNGPNPAVWVGNLDQFFAPKAKVAKVIHHKAVSWRELPTVIKEPYGSLELRVLWLLFSVR